MATSVTTSLPAWLTGCTYDASAGNDLRNSTVTALLFNEGILTGSTIGVMAGVLGGAGLKVTPGGGMTVSVAPGSFAVPAGSPAAGGYTSTLATSGTLTVQTADPSNPRIDIVVAFVNDLGTSSSSGAVEIITGTAAASPSAPSAPASSVTLAQLTIPAGTSTVTSGMIADKRLYTVAAGGVLVSPKATAPTGYTGLLAYDAASGSFYHLTGSGARQAKVLPFAPVHVVLTGTYGYPAGHYSNILSCSVTTDGMTDIKVTYSVGSISPNLSQDVGIEHLVAVDGTTLDVQTKYITTAGNKQQGGFTSVAYTSSASGNTPSAGTHTITFQGQTDFGSSGFPAIHNLSGSPVSAYLRVEPVSL